jgi:hypothetical protein
MHVPSISTVSAEAQVGGAGDLLRAAAEAKREQRSASAAAAAVGGSAGSAADYNSLVEALRRHLPTLTQALGKGGLPASHPFADLGVGAAPVPLSLMEAALGAAGERKAEEDAIRREEDADIVAQIEGGIFTAEEIAAPPSPLQHRAHISDLVAGMEDPYFA